MRSKSEESRHHRSEAVDEGREKESGLHRRRRSRSVSAENGRNKESLSSKRNELKWGRHSRSNTAEGKEHGSAKKGHGKDGKLKKGERKRGHDIDSSPDGVILEPKHHNSIEIEAMGIEQCEEENIQDSSYCLKHFGKGSASTNSGISLDRNEMRSNGLENTEHLDLETGIVNNYMFSGSHFSLAKY